MQNYSVVPDYLIDPRRRDVAAQTRQIVCRALRIKPPTVRWFVNDELGFEWFGENVIGWCAKDGRTIVIHRDYSPFEIASTTVHECRHCWQIANPPWLPVPNTNFHKGLTREQKERDARLFELEFWGGKENRNGSFDEILQILTEMRIVNARARVQAIAPQYPFKRPGLPYSSSFAYPSSGKTRLIVPSEREMEENLLQQILNG